ncbi:MAG: hypothetical protein ACTSXA_10015 [Candidatus Heimdallarchaeota archaeon]
MSQTKHLLELAKRAATKAINAERDREYKVAFDQFLRAAEVLNQLIAIQKNQKVRDTYYVKASEYIKRAKEIKLLMNGPSTKIESKDLPAPPKSTPKPPAPPPKKNLPPPPPTKKTTPPPPPPPPKDQTAKMMRGEDDDTPTLKPSPKDTPKIDKPKVEQKPVPPPPKENVQLPVKTTFELLFDDGKYRECILECTKSVEAELRVRMGLFDEQLTLGMLIERAISKGMETLREFKHVNILLNRIDHENYRPKQTETQKAVEITTKILLS